MTAETPLDDEWQRQQQHLGLLRQLRHLRFACVCVFLPVCVCVCARRYRVPAVVVPLGPAWIARA